MSFPGARPLDPWRWIGVPTLICLSASILFAIPIRLFGLQLPEPVFPLAPAFAWAVIRPSVIAPVALLGMGLFLDFLWGGATGLWVVSMLVGYAIVLFCRPMLTGQSRSVLIGWYVFMVGLSMATAYVVTTMRAGAAPGLLPILGQAVPTLLLYPFADMLIERFEDADVRFR